jgi:hypothetical protein
MDNYENVNGNGTIEPIHYTYSFRDKNNEYKFLKHSLETSTENTVECVTFSPNTGTKRRLFFLCEHLLTYPFTLVTMYNYHLLKHCPRCIHGFHFILKKHTDYFPKAH